RNRTTCRSSASIPRRATLTPSAIRWKSSHPSASHSRPSNESALVSERRPAWEPVALHARRCHTGLHAVLFPGGASRRGLEGGGAGVCRGGRGGALHLPHAASHGGWCGRQRARVRLVSDRVDRRGGGLRV